MLRHGVDGGDVGIHCFLDACQHFGMIGGDAAFFGWIEAEGFIEALVLRERALVDAEMPLADVSRRIASGFE